MCSFVHLDVLWFSAIFVHFELYADIFYFCFRSHFIYVTLLVIDLSIFSRHSEIFFWKQHQTAKDFHWIFAKLSLLCCASHNYKMRFQHKIVSKTQNICFCSWVQWRMAYISIFLFNFFFILSLFLWQYTQMTEIQMICALFLLSRKTNRFHESLWNQCANTGTGNSIGLCNQTVDLYLNFHFSFMNSCKNDFFWNAADAFCRIYCSKHLRYLMNDLFKFDG